MRYAVLITKTEDGYVAEAPDLPGCTATAATVAAAGPAIGAAIRKHLARLERDGLPAPEPSTVVDYVEV